MVAACGESYQLVAVFCGDPRIIDGGGFDLFYEFCKHVRICQIGKLMIPKDGIAPGTSITSIKARMNRPPISSNKSGYNGVYQKKNGKWIAQIGFKGKTYYLGSFSKTEDAVKARIEGEKMYEDFIDRYNLR